MKLLIFSVLSSALSLSAFAATNSNMPNPTVEGKFIPYTVAKSEANTSPACPAAHQAAFRDGPYQNRVSLALGDVRKNNAKDSDSTAQRSPILPKNVAKR